MNHQPSLNPPFDHEFITLIHSLIHPRYTSVVPTVVQPRVTTVRFGCWVVAATSPHLWWLGGWLRSEIVGVLLWFIMFWLLFIIWLIILNYGLLLWIESVNYGLLLSIQLVVWLLFYLDGIHQSGLFHGRQLWSTRGGFSMMFQWWLAAVGSSGRS